MLKQHGRISGIIIDEAEGLPSSAAFRHRFGSLVAAYRLIGYDPEIDYSFIETNRKLRKQHPEIVASVIRRVQELGAVATWDEKTELLHLNRELRVSIVLVPAYHHAGRSVAVGGAAGCGPEAGHYDCGAHGCHERGHPGLLPAARFGHDLGEPADGGGQRHLPGCIPVRDAGLFPGMAERVKIEEAA